MAGRGFIKSISFGLLFASTLVYIIDIVTGGKLTSLLALQPSFVLGKMEIWRLVTFPFVPGSPVSFMLFFTTFFIFAPRIEEILSKPFFIALLFLITVVQGTALTLVFWRSPLTFAGMEGVSFFVATLFAFITRGKKTYIWLFKAIRTSLFILMIFILWGTSILIHSLITQNNMYLVTGSLLALSGIIFGFLTYLQVKLSKKFLLSHLERNNIEIPKPEELTPALIQQNGLKRLNRSLKEESSYYEENIFSEDRLNVILDKINEYGKDSLSPDERKYLEEYSKNL
jgi:membrane associated rhomboid family serine protease